MSPIWDRPHLKVRFVPTNTCGPFPFTEMYLKVALIRPGLTWYRAGLISEGFITGLKKRFKTSSKAVLIKIFFALTHFFKAQNVVKIEFISIQATG